MNPIHTQQERLIQQNEIAIDILKNSRTELYLNMRFLDNALAKFHLKDDLVIKPAGTDGNIFFFNSEEMIRLFCLGRVYINRLYLHLVFHCVFLHVFPEKEINGEELDQEFWDLACDIAIEEMIDGLYLTCLHQPISAFRRKVQETILQEKKTWTAQRIYKKLKELSLSESKLQELKKEYRVDDHRKWYEASPNSPKSQMQKKQWEDIRNKMQTEMETFSKEASKDSKSLMDQLSIENRQKYDYKDFLRKFSVLKEEMKVDMDSFDYIFYNYGMNMYGNMPLIEPLETKEERKIEDFIIVIDTSMSCKGELVKKFLEQTYAILSETESFARRIHVHIIQCDEKIQSDVLIENKSQLEKYMNSFTVIGQGGTDFRPPFVYVEELKRKKVFTKLRGLIYFTDGYGIYPAKKPDYDTAFVFMKEDYKDIDVPPWAIKLILDEEALGE